MRILLFLAVLLLFLVTAFASTGIGHPATDLLSNFHWHFFAGATVLGVFSLLARGWLSLLVACIVCILATFQATRYEALQPQTTTSKESAGALKVYKLVTFNSWARSQNEDRLVKYLRQTKPDFVFLQEIDPPKLRELKSLKDIYPYISYCAEHLCRTVLLSKYAWDDITAGREEMFDLPMMNAVFGPKHGNLRLVHIHTARPSLRYSTQRLQLDSLGRTLASVKDPLVVGGDFNGAVFSAPVRNFAEHSGLGHAGNYLASWPKRTRHLGDIALPFPQIGLDKFFLNRKVRLIHVERGPDLGSDHMPVVLTFAVP